MASVTFPVELGGDGSTVSDDNNPTTGLGANGHRTRFVPSLAQTVQMAATAKAQAEISVDFASSALNAPGTNATSSTSLLIEAAEKSFTLDQTGKAFSVGQNVVIASTASPLNSMIGTITAFTAGTGAVVVEVSSIAGTGTFDDWTISLQGRTGNNPFVTLGIFSVAAASVRPISNFESITTEGGDAPVGAPVRNILFSDNSGLFVRGSSGAANVYTSPDGQVWTARSVPSTGTWEIRMDFSDQSKMYAKINNSTGGTAISDDGGVTWTATTATPQTTQKGARLGNTLFTARSTSSLVTAYTSSDAGATWDTQTLPQNCNAVMMAYAGLFAYRGTTATQYLTSPTGATGTWTVRDFPGGIDSADVHYNPLLGKLAAIGDDGYYTTDDYITWDLQASDFLYSYNGVDFVIGGAALGSTYTEHDGLRAIRITGGTILTTNETGLGAFDPTAELLIFIDTGPGTDILDLSENGPTGVFYAE